MLALRPLPSSTDNARSVARMKEAGADRVAINLQQAMEEVQALMDASDPAAADAEPAQSEQRVARSA